MTNHVNDVMSIVDTLFQLYSLQQLFKTFLVFKYKGECLKWFVFLLFLLDVLSAGPGPSAAAHLSK
jgi:hypothetical protein